ncbi:UNVERIFIED_CONTAM: Transcriptional regulatory protein sin3, partial [Siphonaria sp. JEL0065]
MSGTAATPQPPTAAPRSIVFKASYSAGGASLRRFTWAEADSSLVAFKEKLGSLFGLESPKVFNVDGLRTDGDLAMLLFANASSATAVRVVLVPNAVGGDSDSDGFEMLSDSDNDLVDVASNGSEHRIVKSTLFDRPELDEVEHRDSKSESTVESVEAVYDHMLGHQEIQAASPEQKIENPFHDPVMDSLIESVSKSVLLEFSVDTDVDAMSVISRRTMSEASLELGASALPEHGAAAIEPAPLGLTVAEPVAFETTLPEATLCRLEIVNVEPIGEPEFTEAATAKHEEFAPGRSLNVKDALAYLDNVKAEFHNQPDVYNQFLDVMKDFKAQTIDTPGVIQRVISLFEGHPTLVTGFNTFLLPGYSMPTPKAPSVESVPVSAFGTPTIEGSQEPATRPAIQFSCAIAYVTRIKNQFIDTPHVYHEFLDILQVYQREKLPLAQVYAKVKVLFDDAPDLVEQFKLFLPDVSKKEVEGDDDASMADTEVSVVSNDFEAVREESTEELPAFVVEGTVAEPVHPETPSVAESEPLLEQEEPSSTVSPAATSSEHVDEATFFCQEISPLLDTLLYKIEANPQVIPLLIQRIPETLSGYNFGLSIEGADGSLLGTTRAAAPTTTPAIPLSHADIFAQRMAEHETAMAAHREHMIRHQEDMKAHWLRIPPAVPTTPEYGAFFPPGFPFPAFPHPPPPP